MINTVITTLRRNNISSNKDITVVIVVINITSMVSGSGVEVALLMVPAGKKY